MNFRYRVQLNFPSVPWSEWRDISPIPEASILSIQFDRVVTWEQSNQAMKILFGNIEELAG